MKKTTLGLNSLIMNGEKMSVRDLLVNSDYSKEIVDSMGHGTYHVCGLNNRTKLSD